MFLAEKIFFGADSYRDPLGLMVEEDRKIREKHESDFRPFAWTDRDFDIVTQHILDNARGINK